uniref:Unkown protein n=1 Tax=Riptortus pedestris TaxID=329032 RepID=R4WP23_RIPPE|nr:unkown protein [Riptortus pedestris]
MFIYGILHIISTIYINVKCNNVHLRYLTYDFYDIQEHKKKQCLFTVPYMRFLRYKRI